MWEVSLPRYVQVCLKLANTVTPCVPNYLRFRCNVFHSSSFQCIGFLRQGSLRCHSWHVVELPRSRALPPITSLLRRESYTWASPCPTPTLAFMHMLAPQTFLLEGRTLEAAGFGHWWPSLPSEGDIRSHSVTSTARRSTCLLSKSQSSDVDTHMARQWQCRAMAMQ